MREQKLEIKNLQVSVEQKPIIKRVSLSLKPGELHVLMGPNGSGKSTLALALAGHPRYKITKGTCRLDGENLLTLPPSERAQRGFFLAFQYPSEVPGVKFFKFLWTAYQTTKRREIKAAEFLDLLKDKAAKLQLDPELLERSVNEDFSGGEKKKGEILQLLVLEPKYAVLDETDSGLDTDALKTVAQGINSLQQGKNPTGVLLITHYQRILRFLTPTKVHVMKEGQIVASGGEELAERMEKEGYGSF